MYYPTWILSTAILLASSLSARAGEDSKNSDRPDVATPLASLATGLKPGDWAELKTEMPPGLWRSPKVDDRGGLHIAGWTDDAHWDSRTKQLFYMGMRQTRQFIAYDEAMNAWRIVPLDRESDNPVFPTKFGHIYGNNAFDPATSRFFHRYGAYEGLEGGISAFDAVKQKWEKLPPAPSIGTASGNRMCIEYFAARKGLVVLGKKLRFFSDERQQWEELGDSPVDGYHSMFRHNPFRNEVLLAGGNNNRRVVARIKRDGSVERLKDAPVDLGIRADKLTIDPVSGRYLILHRDRLLYEFDSDQNEYRLLNDFSATPWPFHRHDMPIVAFIPEHGVTLWADSKVWLYKHHATGQAEDRAD